MISRHYYNFFSCAYSSVHKLLFLVSNWKAIHSFELENFDYKGNRNCMVAVVILVITAIQLCSVVASIGVDVLDYYSNGIYHGRKATVSTDDFTVTDDFHGEYTMSRSSYPFYDSEGSYNYYYNHYELSRLYYNYVWKYSYNFYHNHPYYDIYGYFYYNAYSYDYYDSSGIVATFSGNIPSPQTANAVALFESTFIIASSFYDHIYVYNYQDSLVTYNSSIFMPLRPGYSYHDPVVATNGNVIVVGDCDSVLTYVLVNGQWSYSSTLKGHTHSTFGDTLAVSDDTLMVGQNIPGYVFIYSWISSDGSWSLTHTLTGNHGENFGSSLAVDRRRALNGAFRGVTVYSYTRNSNGVWTPLRSFQAPIRRDGRFGYMVAMSGNYAIVSSLYVKELFIYKYASGGWQFQNTLATGAEAFTLYGNTLIVSDQYFNVAAYTLSIDGSAVTDDYVAENDDIASRSETDGDVAVIILAVGLGGGSCLLIGIMVCIYFYCQRKTTHKPVIVPVDEVVEYKGGFELAHTADSPLPV